MSATDGDAQLEPSFRPRVRDVVIRTVGDERVLFDERSGQVHALNPTAATLWPLLDGSWTIEELAGEVAAVHDMDPAIARQQIMAFVVALRDRGLLDG